MLGINDADESLNESKTEFVSDYLALISQFQSLPGKPAVYIVEPPPIFNISLNLAAQSSPKQFCPASKKSPTKQDYRL
jgi:hypothetical protein